MSRPKTQIDWNKVNQYLKAQCDGVGIAGILGIHPNTLYIACEDEFKISFSEYSQQKKSEGKELLRAKQFSMAMEGDKTLCIWLGKQYLDQKDRKDVTSGDQSLAGQIIVETPEQAKQLEDFLNREK